MDRSGGSRRRRSRARGSGTRCTPTVPPPMLRRIMFQQYPQKDVNEPILLHRGRFRLRAGDRCIEPSGSAHLRWLPSPGIAFDIETDEPYAGFDLDSLTVELPGFRTKNVLARSLNLGSTLRIRAFAGGMEWGGEQSLLSAGFQIVNFSDFITLGLSAVPGDPTAIDRDNRTEQRPSEVPTTGAPARSIQSLTNENGRTQTRWLAGWSRCRTGISGPLQSSEGHRRIRLHACRTADENRRLGLFHGTGEGNP